MQDIHPESGSRFGQSRTALCNVYPFPGGILCLQPARPCLGWYPAGGGVVQTSGHVLLMGGSCHMDPKLRLPGQATKAI